MPSINENMAGIREEHGAKLDEIIVLLGSGGGGGSLASGPVFPPAPAADDVFWRTDLKLLFYWDAVPGRWLSVQQYDVTTGHLVLNGSGHYETIIISPLYDIYVVRVECTTFVYAPADAANYWQAYFSLRQSNGDTPGEWNINLSANSYSNVNGLIYNHLNVGLLYPNITNGYFTAMKNGNAGLIRITGRIIYRLALQ